MKAVKMNSEKDPKHNYLLPRTETCSCLNVIDCKIFGFFSKSVKKLVKRGVREREAGNSNEYNVCKKDSPYF